MIVANVKPLADIAALLTAYRRILVVGCGGCVTVCQSGGQKEAEVLALALELKGRLNGAEQAFRVVTLPRQCDPEFVALLAAELDDAEVVVSLACGVGVQEVAAAYPGVWVVPAQNTLFAGANVAPGVWEERCGLCGHCVLHKTGGICPIIRCAKSLLNGPCGGSQRGCCEVSADTPCAWQLIYERLEQLDKLDYLMEIQPVKDWSTAHGSGARRMCWEEEQK